MMTGCGMLASNQPEMQGEHEMATVHSSPYRAVLDYSYALLSVAGSREGGFNSILPLWVYLR